MTERKRLNEKKVLASLAKWDPVRRWVHPESVILGHEGEQPQMRLVSVDLHSILLPNDLSVAVEEVQREKCASPLK